MSEQVAVAADRVGYFRQENGEEGQYVGEPHEAVQRNRGQKRRDSLAAEGGV